MATIVRAIACNAPRQAGSAYLLNASARVDSMTGSKPSGTRRSSTGRAPSPRGRCIACFALLVSRLGKFAERIGQVDSVDGREVIRQHAVVLLRPVDAPSPRDVHRVLQLSLQPCSANLLNALARLDSSTGRSQPAARRRLRPVDHRCREECVASFIFSSAVSANLLNALARLDSVDGLEASRQHAALRPVDHRRREDVHRVASPSRRPCRQTC